MRSRRSVSRKQRRTARRIRSFSAASGTDPPAGRSARGDRPRGTERAPGAVHGAGQRAGHIHQHERPHLSIPGPTVMPTSSTESRSCGPTAAISRPLRRLGEPSPICGAPGSPPSSCSGRSGSPTTPTPTTSGYTAARKISKRPGPLRSARLDAEAAAGSRHRRDRPRPD